MSELHSDHSALMMINISYKLLRIVQDITGIPYSILYGRIDDVPRRIFGRRIDLDRSRNF